MLSIKYRNAYTEVLEIIKYLPKKELCKIPEEKIEYFERNKNSDYIFKFDVSVALEKQNISRETNAIILNLFNDYFLTEEKQKKIQNILEENEKIYIENQRQKYNPDNLFNSKENSNKQENIEETNKLPIEIKRENIFIKITNFIRKIFRKNI